jgi:hypothetical protein
MTTAVVRTTREREGEGERQGDHGDDDTKQARGEKGGRDDATPSLTSSCSWGGQQLGMPKFSSVRFSKDFAEPRTGL